MTQKPKEGWTSQVKLVRFIDGDTLEVELSRRFSIRILDPDNYNNNKWGAEEKNTVAGQRAIEELSKLISPGDTITVFIPSNNPISLMDIQTFNRLLGEVWFYDNESNCDVNLAKWLEEKGLAHKVQHLSENKE